MVINLSTLITTASAQTYRFLAQVQDNLAEVEISSQKFMQDLLNYQPEFLKGQLEYTNQVAHEQLMLGILEALECICQAVIALAGAIYGQFGMASSALEEQESEIGATKSNLSEDSVIEGKLSDEEMIEEGLADQSMKEMTETKGNNIKEATNEVRAKSASNENQAIKSTSAENLKAFQLAEEKLMSARNFIYNILIPAGQGFISAGLKPFEGLKEAAATSEKGLADYLQGLGEMVTEMLKVVEDTISSKEDQERAASEALFNVIRLSSQN